MKVYEAIVKGLESIGATAAFGGAGENAAGLMIALKHSDQIRPVIARHEQAASFMACGYAMYTDRLGVCFATAGPGAFNLFSGLAVAMSEPDAGLTRHVRGHHQAVLPAHRHRRHVRRARGRGQHRV
jgi:acetolactate synthase-1/2/3 large subunit